MDRRLSGGFRLAVLDRLADIAYGQTSTYAAVAAAAGNPKAVRAVGSACAVNPLPIVVPCHRVVRSDEEAAVRLAGLRPALTAAQNDKVAVHTGELRTCPDRIGYRS